jgi:hypothetical protein
MLKKAIALVMIACLTEREVMVSNGNARKIRR